MITIKGKITKVTDKEFTTKEGEVKKYIEVTVEEQQGEYPDSIMMPIWNERVDRFKKYNKVGDFGTCNFSAKIKEANGRTFNQLGFHSFYKEDVKAEAPENIPNATDDELPF